MTAAGDKEPGDGARTGGAGEASDVDILALRSKVTHAVRTAITDVVTKSGASPPLSETDFDFSMPAGSDAVATTLPPTATPYRHRHPAHGAIGDIRPGELETVSVWRHQLPAEIAPPNDGPISRSSPALPVIAAFLAGLAISGGLAWQLYRPDVPVQDAAAPAATAAGPSVVASAGAAVDPESVARAKTAVLEATLVPDVAEPGLAASEAGDSPQDNEHLVALAQPETAPEPAGTTAVPPVLETTAAAPAIAQTVAILKKTEALIGAGEMAAARQLLLAHAETTASADIALALAKSYDANVLTGLGDPSIKPDAAEAERWYRRWYELAVRDGMAADPKRLERLVRSLK